MIKSFKHKGLRSFFETGSLAGIQASHAKRLRMQLAALDTAQTIEDMDVPGFRLHPLKGDRMSIWSITVSGNWRVTLSSATAMRILSTMRIIINEHVQSTPSRRVY